MLRKYLIKGSVFFLFFVLLVGARVLQMQIGHYKAAERYYSEASWKLAIREYDSAMHNYVPFSPYLQRSAERLWQIGEMFEKEGKLEWANLAYASIRSSLYATRSLYTPRTDWIEKCDEKIAELNVQVLVKEGSVKPEDAKAEKEKHLYVMKVDRAPRPFWTVGAEAGFFGWVASVVFITIRGFDDRGKVRGRVALYGVLSFIVTFTLWVISLLKA